MRHPSPKQNYMEEHPGYLVCAFPGPHRWPLLLAKGYIYGDLGALYLPYRPFIHRPLQLGVFPLCDPFGFGGLYLHGEGQFGLFHPFHLLNYP